MLEKALNARKNFILLRSRFVAIAVSFALLLCPMAFSASAVELDYNDYITNVSIDGENDIVTVEFPVEANTHYTLFELVNGSYSKVRDAVASSVIYQLYPGHVYAFQFIPLYGNEISLADIPDGTKVSVDVDFRFNADRAFNTPYLTNFVRYNGNGVEVGSEIFTYDPQAPDWMFPADFVVSKPSGATNFTCTFAINEFSFAVGGDVATSVSLYVKSYSMTMSISSLLRLQQESGRTNKILAAVEQQLAENGQTLEEVLQQQQQTNDKLDKLPGQIGDEMQGVIENEKEESKDEGNKFVDQILDALPDPSQDVLAALKGLTDSMAYTGTDAVLPIPAIVLPGIDGLFPETEIWGGTEFDFGDYIGMLAPALMTLVQSLFTIAIVLFCVYELKDIISYCLTLRESKGG